MFETEDTTRISARHRHRPGYHFLPASNWMNDPNGLIRHNGEYHLFYQYNPDGPFHANMHWGHAASEDMVRWEHLPVALAPTSDSPDEDGCFSGCAVNDDGVPTFVYTGVRGDEQLPCIARATDLERLTEWEKHPGNPVISETPPGLDLVAYRDHSVWKEGDEWLQIVGSGIEGEGGAALLYRSPDLINWEYLHPLFIGGGADDPVWTGSMWECPDFFPLGDKHVLIVSVYDEGNLHYAAYFIGEYRDRKFFPETQGIVDNGGHFYAPQSMSDDDGRRIMWGWLREGRDEKEVAKSGWTGVMSLPRILSVEDGELHTEPAPELEKLRTEHHRLEDVRIAADEARLLDGVRGNRVEISAVFEVGDASRFGIEVRCSPDREERTTVVFDTEAGEVFVATSESGVPAKGRSEPGTATFAKAPGEAVEARIFVDSSVVEVFVDGRTCITELVYPTRPDSLGVGVFSHGGDVKVKSLDMWELDRIWPEESAG